MLQWTRRILLGLLARVCSYDRAGIMWSEAREEPRTADRIARELHLLLHGMAGNAWEWVTPVWFVPGTTPVNEESRGIRGGSFRSPPFFLRTSNRSDVFYSGTEYDDIGFRVVWPAAAGRD